MSSLRAENKLELTLLDAEVGINGGIAGSSGEVLALSVWDVFASIGKSEIQDEDLMGDLVESYTEVIGFDVSLDELSIVDVFYP